MNYMIGAYKNVRLKYDFIEANTPEEAKRIYTEKVNRGEIEVSNPQWWTFTEGDCDEPMQADEIITATLDIS